MIGRRGRFFRSCAAMRAVRCGYLRGKTTKMFFAAANASCKTCVAITLTLIVLSLAALGQSDSLQRGLELFRQEKYEEALQQFQEARRLQPANASIDNFIGITETKLGRIDEANKDYETASRIDPKLAGPHTNLGFNYLSKKQYELSEKQLRTALALDSADPFTHYYLAVLYLTTAREKEAIPHIEPAITLLDNDPAAALLAIKACLTSNAPAEASKLINLVEQHSRFSAEQEYELAKLLEERQMYVESAALSTHRRDAALVAEPVQSCSCPGKGQADEGGASPPGLLNRGACPTDANLLQLISRPPTKPRGRNWLALDAWQKAIAADPANPDRYLDCTRLLIDLDRYKEATDIVQRGISLVPDDYPLTIRLVLLR